LAFFTGGTDGWVRSSSALAPQQTMRNLYEADLGDKQIVALSFHAPNAVLVGVERDGTDGEARLISQDKGELVTNITKTPLGVRDVSSSGNWAAVATEKSGLRVVDVTAIEHMFTLGEHTGPVKGVAFDSTGKLLASTGADGCLKVYDCETTRW
jgi:WD40 repeat protein